MVKLITQYPSCHGNLKLNNFYWKRKGPRNTHILFTVKKGVETMICAFFHISTLLNKNGMFWIIKSIERLAVRSFWQGLVQIVVID